MRAGREKPVSGVGFHHGETAWHSFSGFWAWNRVKARDVVEDFRETQFLGEKNANHRFLVESRVEASEPKSNHARLVCDSLHDGRATFSTKYPKLTRRRFEVAKKRLAGDKPEIAGIDRRIRCELGTGRLAAFPAMTASHRFERSLHLVPNASTEAASLEGFA